jgi:MoxR-like ATPase
MSSMFASADDAAARLAGTGYLPSREIATVVFLADRMEKPVLVEGPAGVGKTDLARAFAAASGRTLVRLQCYEGLDEAKALYEWEYAKQLLYTQMLKERIGETVQGAPTLAAAADRIAAQGNVFFSERFLLPRPILRAVTSEEPVLLLVDEVDKADPEFEAFLLEVLADYAVTIPELGTFRSKRPPRVVLTSNAARDLSDALKRRCLHLFIDYPAPERELAIVRARVPEAGEELARQAVAAVSRLRGLDLKKAPSISETLDWVRALVILEATVLDERLVSDTLNLLLKYEADVERARERIREVAGGAPA